jgi:hypothetical protein
LAFLANLVGTSSDPDAAVGEVVLGFTGVVLAMIFGLFALLYLITGWGLLKFRPWGRTLGIVVAAISLLKFPIGTAFGIYALVILFRKETEALFAKQSDRPAGA